MATSEVINAACNNGTGAAQYVGSLRFSVSDVVDLLVASADRNRHTAIRVNANRLLEMMSRTSWQIAAGQHRGGLGGRERGPDGTTHVTLRVNGSGYHLRQDGRGHLFEISGRGMLNFAPWAAPGTPINRTK